jgi:hypothetical protein
MQGAMPGKLGSVVEGDGLAQRLRYDAKQVDEMARDPVGSLAGQPDRQQETRLALMHGQDRLTVFSEHHQIGFPVTAGLTIRHLDRPVCHGNTAFNEVW